MSQLTSHMSDSHSADHAHAHAHGVDPALLRHDNTHLPAGWGKGLMALLGVAGVACLILTAAYPSLAGGEGEKAAKAVKHAMASYHVGFVTALGIMLGALAFVLIMHLVKAGWSVTIRRQAENLASLMPLGVVFALPMILFGGKLFKWFDPALAKTDTLLQAKSAYLNPTAFYARLVLYFVVWCYLAFRLNGYSLTQDKTGDKSLTNKASWTSAWGILAFALVTAFAGVDLLKTLDFHWFSTMFGVYFFAGCMLSAIAVLALLMVLIRSSGKLEGLFTKEHSHDLGKLMLAFMVFWAYVAFSQYFLIWYANIPEETAWVLQRGGGSLTNAWTPVFWILCIGHFLAPFPLLIIRKSKQSFTLISLFAVWLLVMQIVDFFWVVRPMVYPDKYIAPNDVVTISETTLGLTWVDFTGALGPVLVLLAAAIWRMSRVPLIPIKDPRLPEAATHKNYV